MTTTLANVRRYQYNRYRIRRAYGLCVRCREPSDGKTYCDKHRKYDAARKKRERQRK
jgi:hypothetical protein